jgi:hypothetical protein
LGAREMEGGAPGGTFSFSRKSFSFKVLNMQECR